MTTAEKIRKLQAEALALVSTLNPITRAVVGPIIERLCEVLKELEEKR